MGPIQTIDDVLGLVWRRRWLIAAVVVIGMLVSVILGLTRPKYYETGAVIQVQTPIVGTEDAAAVGARAAQMLQSIEQRLTTRENLVAMIDRHGLFADAPGLSTDQKIAALRSSIRFQSVASADQPGFGAPQRVSALIISTQFGDGDQAARVANDLAQSVLDMSSARQATRAQETYRFYVDESARIDAQVAALERQITDFKNTHADSLPGSAESRRSALTSLETELRALEQSRAALDGERTAIERKQNLRETDRRRLEEIAAQSNVLDTQRASLEAQRQSISDSLLRQPAVEQELAAFERQMVQLQAQSDVVVTRLAEAESNLRLDEMQQGERFALLERAIIPEYASGGGGKKVAAMGTIGSLGLALGLAFLLDLLFPAVRTSAQMERELDLRPVVAIPEIAFRNTGKRWPQLPFDPQRLTDAIQGAPRPLVYFGGAVLFLLAAAAAMA